MFMNLTIHDIKQFMSQNISSLIHNLYLDSTTMPKTNIITKVDADKNRKEGCRHLPYVLPWY